MYLKSRSDVEDVFQEVFLKYALHVAVFENQTHERAWFVRVSINSCKDVLKGFWRQKVHSLEDADVSALTISDQSKETLDAVLRLKPKKYRIVIYLHYFEGYKATEIAQILGVSENTVYTWLKRAREQLKSALGGESFGG